MPTNKLEHNPHVAGLYRAIALRFYCLMSTCGTALRITAPI
jgi:hypothetical protein